MRAPILVATSDPDLASSAVAVIGADMPVELLWDVSRLASVAARIKPAVVLIDGRDSDAAHPLLMAPVLARSGAFVIVVGERRGRQFDKLAAAAGVWDCVTTSEIREAISHALRWRGYYSPCEGASVVH